MKNIPIAQHYREYIKTSAEDDIQRQIEEGFRQLLKIEEKIEEYQLKINPLIEQKEMLIGMLTHLTSALKMNKKTGYGITALYTLKKRYLDYCKREGVEITRVKKGGNRDLMNHKDVQC